MPTPAIFNRVSIALIGLAWVGAVGLGARKLLTYETTPGVAGPAPLQWPSQTGMARPAGQYVLVMFAHPECPCTRASLTELEILTTRLPGKLAAFVEFRKPGASRSEVQSLGVWRRAAAIPGVSVGFDDAGREVRNFGAEVSGQTLLFDPRGRLVFSGGITAARGHEGDNPGVDAVTLLARGSSAPLHAPVFGCSLRDPDALTLNQDPMWKKP